MPTVINRPQARRDKSDLLTLLRVGHVQQRSQAAADLVDFPDCATMLGARLAVEPDAQVRAALLASLGKLNSEAAAGALLALLQTDDVALRSACSDVLTRMPCAVASSMQVQLHDINPVVRKTAIGLLADLEHPDIQAWLLQVLATEPAPDCVTAAVEVLARLDAIELAPALHAVRLRFPADACLRVAIDMAIAAWRAAD